MEEIINNIMQSPENTNPNVLRSQLQNIEGGSGGGGVVYATFTDNKGWSCDKTYAELKAAYDAGCVIIGVVNHEFSFFSPLSVILLPVEQNGSILGLGGFVSTTDYRNHTNVMATISGVIGIGNDNSVSSSLVFNSIHLSDR